MKSPTNNKDSVKNAIIYLFGNILNGLLPFILLPILTRILSPTSFGELGMFQTLVAVLNSFIGLGVHAAINRMYFDSSTTNDSYKTFIGSAIHLLLITTTIVIAIFLVFSNYLMSVLGVNLQWAIIAIGTSACTFIINIRLSQWQVRSQPILYSAFQISQSFINVSVSILLLVAFAKGSYGRVLGIFLASLIFCLVSLWTLHKENLIDLRRFKPEYIKQLLNFGLPLVPHTCAAFIIVYIDRYFIKSNLGLHQLGLYIAVSQIAAAGGLLVDAMNKAYVPWLYSRLALDNDSTNMEVVKLSYAFFFIAIVIATFVQFGSKWITVTIAGAQYVTAAASLKWFIYAHTFKAMYYVVTNYIFYSKKTIVLGFITTITSIFNIGMLYFLVPLLGIEGASISFCAAMLLQFLVTWFFANKLHPMPWLGVFSPKIEPS